MVNGEATQVNDATTLYDLIQTTHPNLESGIAAAVNERVIRRNLWQQTLLNPNDSVEILRAVCGG